MILDSKQKYIDTKRKTIWPEMKNNLIRNDPTIVNYIHRNRPKQAISGKYLNTLIK